MFIGLLFSAEIANPNFGNFGQDLEIVMTSVTDEGMTMEFDIVGAFPALVNALRRTLMVEVCAGYKCSNDCFLSVE